jgi:hypothetical protein
MKQKENTVFFNNGGLLRKKMIEMLIVGSTGLGYAIVGTLQGLKGEYSNMMIWLGYAVAQIGLFINLK